MRGTVAFAAALFALSISISVAGAQATDRPASGSPDGLGKHRVHSYGSTAETAYQINAWEFEGSASGLGTSPTGIFQRYVTSGGGTLIAGARLPSGAAVTGFEVAGCDQSVTSDLSAQILACADPDQGCTVVASVSTSGTPGCGFFSETSPISHTVDNSNNSYFISVSLEDGANLTLRAARIFYKLQVSPAPLTATFGDVPTDFLYFRAIEAMAAAGITTGCGGGNFCPEQNVTRGELAKFLANALGLHWPN